MHLYRYHFDLDTAFALYMHNASPIQSYGLGLVRTDSGFSSFRRPKSLSVFYY